MKTKLNPEQNNAKSMDCGGGRRTGKGEAGAAGKHGDRAHERWSSGACASEQANSSGALVPTANAKALTALSPLPLHV